MTILANDLGAVSHAWLDGSLLDPSCQGYRCRLIIGDKGGLICDRITGSKALKDHQVEALARHTVLNVDPAHGNPLPITDDNGRAVRIVLEDGEPPICSLVNADPARLRAEMIPATHVPARLPGEQIPILVLCGLILPFLCAAALAWFSWPELRAEAVLGLMIFGFGLVRLRKAYQVYSQAYIEAPIPEVVAVFREIERRERAPSIITGAIA